MWWKMNGTGESKIKIEGSADNARIEQSSIRIDRGHVIGCHRNSGWDTELVSTAEAANTRPRSRLQCYHRCVATETLRFWSELGFFLDRPTPLVSYYLQTGFWR